MSIGRHFLLLLVLSPSAAASAPAAVADTNTVTDTKSIPTHYTLQTLMQALASVNHLEASFRDQKYSGLLQFPLVSEGRFEFRAPDFIARRVSVPAASLFEVDGDQIRIERDGKLTLIDARDQPMLADLLRAIRAILGGDLDYLRDLFVLNLRTDGPDWTLQMRPSDARLAQYLELLEVAGQGRRVDSLRLYESSGDHTDTVFSQQRIR